MLRLIFVAPPGERACLVFRTAGNPNDLTLLFEWEHLERARGYMNSEELRKKMKQAGVVGDPEIHYLAEIYFDPPQRGRLICGGVCLMGSVRRTEPLSRPLQLSARARRRPCLPPHPVECGWHAAFPE